MHFEPLTISGAMRVRLDRHADHRGFFARTFCTEEFSKHGLPSDMVQSSISYNAKRGTLRGMHFQWPPSQEGKLVRCIRGGIFDVLLDLRPDSPTYLQHQAIELDQDNRDAVFIPPGIAHGFQTLVDESEILYQMTDYFVPQLADGVRWNDPAFGICWPIAGPTLSPRDADYPDFDRLRFENEVRRHGDCIAGKES